MPFNDLGRNAGLDGLGASITHIGVNALVTAPPSDGTPGSGATAAGTEATGGSPPYSRKAATWAPAASSQKSNSAALTFDVPPGTYAFLSLWGAPTGNTGTQYRGWLPINGSIKGFGEVDSADVTADTITSSSHGLVTGDRVICFNVFSESLPAGLTEGAVYYVVGATTDTFQVSSTLGGSAVAITGQGELYWQKIIPETFASQGQIVVDIGAAVLDGTGI